MENDQYLLDGLHKVELEIMDVIHNICIENNLKYSIAYGSLIGAVRHGGFIPWDDDFDIIMPRKDYEKFKLVWSQTNHDGYILQDIENTPEFTQTFMKVRKLGTLFEQVEESAYTYNKGIFVDIFPLDKIPTNSLQKNIYKLAAVINLLYCRKYLSNSNKFQNIIEKILLKLPCFIKNIIWINAKKHLKKFNNYEYNFIGSAIVYDLKCEFPPDLFDNLILGKFENRQYLMSKKYDDFLKSRYGNYMQYPPKEEQTWKHKPLNIQF